jgi:hypothetical protein
MKKLFLLLLFFSLFSLASANPSLTWNSGLSAYEITNCVQLQSMNLNVSGSYALMNNIDCSATTGWNSGQGFVPIGNELYASMFYGIIDGRNFNITSLYINRPSTFYIGLFGYTNSSTIKNFNIVNTNITGSRYTGGLVAYAVNTTIINVSSKNGNILGENGVGGLVGNTLRGSIIIDSNAQGVVRNTAGSYGIGGLVGFMGTGGSTIERSYSEGSIYSFSSGGLSYAGGLVGWAVTGALIQNSYSHANVTSTGSWASGFIPVIESSSIVNNSYSTGYVNSTHPNSAGFIVANSSAFVYNSFYDTNTSGKNNTGLGEPKTTQEMKSIVTYLFLGWDIISSKTNKNSGYPYLTFDENKTIWEIYTGGDYSYQESANVTNQTGIDGGYNLIYTGAYQAVAGTDAFDYSYPAYLYINYTKPLYATFGSIWRVKMGSVNNPIKNLLIPESCWGAYSNKVVFRQYSGTYSPTTGVDCYNGTSWYPLYNFSSNDGILSINVKTEHNYQNAIDGNWSTYAVGFNVLNNPAYFINQTQDVNINENLNSLLWEEAMMWYFPGVLESPKITLNYPTALINYAKLNQALQLNFTVTDDNLDKVWYNYNGTNVTIVGAVSGVANLSNITLSTKKNVTFCANDTAGNTNCTTFSWNYRIFENSRTFNSSTFETASETYSINVTANNSLTAMSLKLDGVSYPMLNVGLGIWSVTRDIPVGLLGTKNVIYSSTYSGTTIDSDATNQTISPIFFNICNATYTTPFINFTFKDESTLLPMGASFQTANFEYYLGSGTEKKTYLYNNASSLFSYAFCATPNRTLYVIPSITYVNTSYPARLYSPGTLTLSNTTTNEILYLLSASEGIYSTFQTITSGNVLITGASIIITRVLEGVTTIMAQGTTDSAGSYTVWLNPNYDHTVTASKDGFGSSTVTIRPTQTSYTLVLTGTSNYTYVSNFEGLLWGFFPRRNLNISEINNFGFNITSAKSNIVSCKIELLPLDKSSVLASAETIASNASFCSVQVSYLLNSTYPRVKGRLLIDTGEGYQILEEDAYWIAIPYTTTGLTITDWFNSLTLLDLRYFNGDEQHREFTYILLFFLVATIICAVMNKMGWDIQTNGGMIYLMGGMVWFASIPGFLNLANISPFTIMDKYFVAVIYSMFMIGFGARNT